MDRTDEDRAVDTAGLADRIWLAAKAERHCEVTPEEMDWLKCSFALGDPQGESEFNSWLLRSSEAFRSYVPASSREQIPTDVPSVHLVVRRRSLER